MKTHTFDLRRAPHVEQAAHVALIMLRAAVKAKTRTPHRFCVGGHAPRKPEEVARELAVTQKPVALHGVRHRRCVEMSAEPAATSANKWVAFHLEMLDREPKPGSGLLSFLTERHGPAVDELPLACAAGGIVVLAEAAAVASAQRDYALTRPTGYGMDWADGDYAAARGVERDALKDAVAFIQFDAGGGCFFAIPLPWHRG